MKSIRLDLAKLVTAIVLIAAFTMAVRVPTSPDMWWHLRCGEIQWRTRTVLKTDVLSHTASGAPWVNQSWLPQLAMYGLYSLGGFPALALGVAALVAAISALVLAAARSEGRYAIFWRAFVVLWAAIASGRVWAARPHLITLLLTAAWVYLLDRHRQSGTRSRMGVLLWLPPLMCLWANCHGGTIIGFVLLAIEGGGIIADAISQRQAGDLWARIRPLLIVAALCIVAALINPQGIRLLLFPLQTLGSVAQQNAVAEWASPDFHAADMLPFLAFLLATWSAVALSGRRVTGTELLSLLGFSAMALRSGRYLGLCAVVLAPILALHGGLALARLGRKWGIRSGAAGVARGSAVINWALLLVLLAAAGIKVTMPLAPQTIDEVHGQLFPEDAVAYLQRHDLPPTLFNEYGWGGYLAWHAYPDVPVFIDGRADPYGDELILAYQQAISARTGWEEILDSHQVGTALLPVDSALASVMRAGQEWEEVHRDDVAAVFVRVTEPSG